MQTANWDMPTETDYDGFGRAVVSKTYEDLNNAITTYTTYNALGLVATVRFSRRYRIWLYSSKTCKLPLLFVVPQLYASQKYVLPGLPLIEAENVATCIRLL
jgi:hypothetical protein